MGNKKKLCSLPLLFLLVTLPSSSSLQAQNPNAKYLGAASCASSNCHGGAAPRTASNVLQNEYVTWVKHDRHAEAWRNLTNEDSKKIAKNLGIKEASSDKLCLQCHSTYVPEKNLQGEKYNIEDGVSCESCHGASEKWISTHTEKGATHAKNVKNGLVEIVPLEARAKLCLSCHYGTDDKTVNHRLIGAGHPRLSFELDTFSMIQPKHWEYDKDYIERKFEYQPIQAWLVGQIALAREMVAAMGSPVRSRNGIWPELTLFTCYSCHHSLLGDQWKVRDYSERPGELRLNLSALLTVREALEVLSPSAADKLSELIAALHGSYKSGEGSAALAKLDSELRLCAELINSMNFTDDQANNLLKKIVHFAANTPHFQYEEAEQLAMGVSAIISSLDSSAKLHRSLVDGMYQALKNPEDFVAEEFTTKALEFEREL